MVLSAVDMIPTVTLPEQTNSCTAGSTNNKRKFSLNALYIKGNICVHYVHQIHYTSTNINTACKHTFQQGPSY